MKILTLVRGVIWKTVGLPEGLQSTLEALAEATNEDNSEEMVCYLIQECYLNINDEHGNPSGPPIRFNSVEERAIFLAGMNHASNELGMGGNRFSGQSASEEIKPTHRNHATKLS